MHFDNKLINMTGDVFVSSNLQVITECSGRRRRPAAAAVEPLRTLTPEKLTGCAHVLSMLALAAAHPDDSTWKHVESCDASDTRVKGQYNKMGDEHEARGVR